MAVTTFNQDVHVNGSFAATSLTLPTGAVFDTNVSAAAEIDADKLEHLHKPGTTFGVSSQSAAAADVYRILFCATGAAVVRIVKATILDTGTSTDIKFDLLKATAGSESLTTMMGGGTIDFVHGDTDNTPKAGSLTVTALAAGDLVVAHMDYTSATNVQGVWMWCEISESAN